MDSNRFDRLARSLARENMRSRRGVLRTAAGGLVVGLWVAARGSASTQAQVPPSLCPEWVLARYPWLCEGNEPNPANNSNNDDNDDKKDKDKDKGTGGGTGCTVNCDGKPCGADDGCGGSCGCPTGQDCLPGGSCATPCNDRNRCTGSGCVCSASIEGPNVVCVVNNVIADSCDGGCPLGSACLGGSICVELCPHQTP